MLSVNSSVDKVDPSFSNTQEYVLILKFWLGKANRANAALYSTCNISSNVFKNKKKRLLKRDVFKCL